MIWLELAILALLVITYLSVWNMNRRFDKIETYLQNIWEKLNGLD